MFRLPRKVWDFNPSIQLFRHYEPSILLGRKIRGNFQLNFRNISESNKPAPQEPDPMALLAKSTLKKKIMAKKAWIVDMDGVLYHSSTLLPGVKEFLQWLKSEQKKYLFLTNASDTDPHEKLDKIYRLSGVEVVFGTYWMRESCRKYFD
jgi:hypothetical protein